MKGKLLIIYFSLLIIGFSCGKAKTKKIVTNKDIISFHAISYLQSSQLNSLDTTIFSSLHNSDTLNNKIDTVKYSDKEIYISYLDLTTCGNYTGDFTIYKDTLKLKLVSTSDITCTEINCDRIIFRIKRTDNKKYIIRR